MPRQDPVRWVVKDLIQMDVLNILAGEPGVGKTSIVTHLAACVAAGLPVLGRPTMQGNVLFVNFDDPSALPREQAEMSARGVGFENLGDLGIYYWQPADDMDLPVKGLEDEGALAEVVALVEACAPILIIVDSFSAAFPHLNGNAGQDIQRIRHVMRRVLGAAGTGPAVLLIDHTPKPMSNDDARRGVSGSQQKHAIPRTVHLLNHESDDGEADVLRWHVFKANGAKSRYTIGIRRYLDVELGVTRFELAESSMQGEPTTLRSAAFGAALEVLRRKNGEWVRKSELVTEVMRETEAKERTVRTAVEDVLFREHANVGTQHLDSPGRPIAHRWVERAQD